MSSEALSPAPLPPGSHPPSPVGRVADRRGVGTQSLPADEVEAANNSAPRNPGANSEGSWPSWAPPLPTDIPAPPWEVEGRRPRPDELAPQLDTPARSPADYTLPTGMLGPDPCNVEALTNGRALQSLLYSAALPAHEGAGLLQAIADATRGVDADMDDAAFESRTRETERVLKRQLGETEYARRREALSVLLADLDRKSGGALADLLGENAVVLTDPLVMAKLLAHAGRIANRRR